MAVSRARLIGVVLLCACTARAWPSLESATPAGSPAAWQPEAAATRAGAFLDGLADAGITLSRATLTHYVQRSIALLEPIVEAQWRHILQSKVLAMDETPIKAGKAGKGKLKTTWYWPVYGEDDEICFTWSTSRGSGHVKAQLGDFAGTLLSDGYAAYDAYARSRPEVTQAQCWAHTRRYFERAQGSDPAAAQGLEWIGALYRVERQIRDAWPYTGVERRSDRRHLMAIPVWVYRGIKTLISS